MMRQEAPRILVVDDDPDIRENLSDILTDLGYHVDIASDGPSALELVDRQAYDVALLDLKMPGMDGVALYREIKKRHAGTVSMIVTAFAGAATAEEALSAGAWKVLAKPVDFPKLLQLMEEAIDQPLVLVVDDDRDLCENLWDLLRDRGFRVCLAHDLQHAGGKTPRLIVRGRPDRHANPRWRWRQRVPTGSRHKPASPDGTDHRLSL